MNHKNWYTQRYSKTNPAITQSLQDKLDNFRQIDEYNKQKKENLVNEAIALFTQHNIPYQLKNENIWIVTLFNQNYYYYPRFLNKVIPTHSPSSLIYLRFSNCSSKHPMSFTNSSLVNLL